MRQRLASVAGIELNQVGVFKAVSSGKPVQVSILGQDRKVLDELARQVMAIMRDTAGVVDIDSSSKGAKPQVSVELKRELASDQGIGLAQVASTLRPLLAGQAVGNWRGPDDLY